MTCASRESNPVPLDSESEGQPTRVVWHQKTASLRDLYGSKIWSDCVRARRGFIFPQKYEFYADMPAGAVFFQKKSGFSADMPAVALFFLKRRFHGECWRCPGLAVSHCLSGGWPLLGMAVFRMLGGFTATASLPQAVWQ